MVLLSLVSNFEATSGARKVEVIKARQTRDDRQSPFRPASIEDVISRIKEWRPAIVFAPHVETSAGMILPPAYPKGLSSAAHEVGALMALDCIASGCAWVDMRSSGFDVLMSAPQKSWSASPSTGLVLMSERAVKHFENTSSDSFAIDLKKNGIR